MKITYNYLHPNIGYHYYDLTNHQYHTGTH